MPANAFGAGLLTMQFYGLPQLQLALRQLPGKIQETAEVIIRRSTEDAARNVRNAYPLGPPGRFRKGVAIEPGGMRRGVRTRYRSGGPGVFAGQVRSTAPHAHLWEFGTKPRRYRGRWKHFKNVGTSPTHYNQGLVGIAIDARSEMLTQLVALVRSHGFTVHGA